MIYKTKIRFARISPRKVRFILSRLNNLKADLALEILANRPEKAAKIILSGLKSSIDAAKARDAIEEDLRVVRIVADDGPRIKRRLIKARGRADLIAKKMAHLTIIMKDKKKRKKYKKEVERVEQKTKI